jgi:hypothetical protein
MYNQLLERLNAQDAEMAVLKQQLNNNNNNSNNNNCKNVGSQNHEESVSHHDDHTCNRNGEQMDHEKQQPPSGAATALTPFNPYLQAPFASNAMIVENPEPPAPTQSCPPFPFNQGEHASDSNLLQLLNHHQVMNQMSSLQNSFQQHAMNQSMQQQLQQIQQQLQMQQMQQSMLLMQSRSTPLTPAFQLQAPPPYLLQHYRPPPVPANQLQAANQATPQREFIWHNLTNSK